MTRFLDLDLIHEEPTDEQEATLRNNVVEAVTSVEDVVLRLTPAAEGVVIATVYYIVKAVCKTLAEMRREWRERAGGRHEACIRSFLSLPVGLCGWVSQKTWQTVSSTHLASPCCLACSITEAAT
jgi:hypothetical protein